MKRIVILLLMICLAKFAGAQTPRRTFGTEHRINPAGYQVQPHNGWALAGG